MALKFRDAFLAALKVSNRSIPEIAAAAEVSKDQLNKLKQRPVASTNVDDAVRIANAFGLDIAEFLEDNTAQDRAAILGLYSQLTDRERSILLAASKANPV